MVPRPFALNGLEQEPRSPSFLGSTLSSNFHWRLSRVRDCLPPTLRTPRRATHPPTKPGSISSLPPPQVLPGQSTVRPFLVTRTCLVHSGGSCLGPESVYWHSSCSCRRSPGSLNLSSTIEEPGELWDLYTMTIVFMFVYEVTSHTSPHHHSHQP